jgi:hypothetical protein
MAEDKLMRMRVAGKTSIYICPLIYLSIAYRVTVFAQQLVARREGVVEAAAAASNDYVSQQQGPDSERFFHSFANVSAEQSTEEEEARVAAAAAAWRKKHLYLTGLTLMVKPLEQLEESFSFAILTD